MKGILHKTDNEWVVEYAEHEQLPLYPDDAKIYQNEYDYYGAIGFKGKEVDFEIVNIVTNKNTLSDDDIVLLGTYAKIINHISDISKMVVYTHDDVIKMMDTFHTSILNRDLCMAKLTPIELPQQEISDEEIEKWAKEYTCKEYGKLIFDYENYDTYGDFVNGAKKYREQLKTK